MEGLNGAVPFIVLLEPKTVVMVIGIRHVNRCARVRRKSERARERRRNAHMVYSGGTPTTIGTIESALRSIEFTPMLTLVSCRSTVVRAE